ncbi:MAG: hypothetical protein ABIP68_05940 [Ferruginibacter sp.]
MRIRKDHLHLISVVLYAETTLGQRSGKPLNVQYVYKLIDKHEKDGKKIPFDFVKIGKVYWIVRD